MGREDDQLAIRRVSGVIVNVPRDPLVHGPETRVRRAYVTDREIEQMDDGHVLMFSEVGDRAAMRAMEEGRVLKLRAWRDEAGHQMVFEWIEVVRLS